jgi:gluconate 5-dehydrogenase
MHGLLQADLVASMLLSQSAARLMKDAGSGRLIAVTSIAGHLASRADCVYDRRWPMANMARSGLRRPSVS